MNSPKSFKSFQQSFQQSSNITTPPNLHTLNVRKCPTHTKSNETAALEELDRLIRHLKRYILLTLKKDLTARRTKSVMCFTSFTIKY